MYPSSPKNRPNNARRSGTGRAWDRALLQTGLQTLAVAALTVGGVAVAKLNFRAAEPAPALKELTELTARAATDHTAKFVLDRLGSKASTPAASEVAPITPTIMLATVATPSVAPAPVALPSIELLPPLVRADFASLLTPDVAPAQIEPPAVVSVAAPELPRLEPTTPSSTLVIAAVPESHPETPAPEPQSPIGTPDVLVPVVAPATLDAEAQPAPQQLVETPQTQVAPIAKSKRAKVSDEDAVPAKPATKKHESNAKRDSADRPHKSVTAKKRHNDDDDADEKASRKRKVAAPVSEPRSHRERSREYGGRPDYALSVRHEPRAIRWVGRGLFWGARVRF